MQDAPQNPSQEHFLALAGRLLVESVERAAAENQHGRSEILITFYEGQIRQVEEVYRSTHR